MSIFFTAALNLLVTTLPYRILAYYPFRDRLRLPAWVVAFLIITSELIEICLYGYVIASGGNGRLLEFIFAPICIIIYFSSIKADPFKLLFLYMFVMDYIMIVKGLAAFIEIRFFYSSYISFYSLQNTLLHFGLFVVTVPLILVFLKKTKERIFHTDAPYLWRTIWLVPAFNSLIVLMYTGSFTPVHVQNWRFILARLFLLVCIFIVYYILLQALDTIRKQASLEEQAKQYEQIIALQRTRHRQLEKHMNETKQARHDLRQHLQIIQAYLDNGDNNSLKAYISAYGKKLPPDTFNTYCKNYATDVVIRYYAEEARFNEIDFSVRLSLPEVLPISEPEFCALLGNLLENAVDACRKLTDIAPFIRVNGRMDGQKIIVTVDNTCLDEPKQIDGRFLSTKHEGFGTGTLSVQSIAERNSGITEFSYQDGIFYASVMLNFKSFK